MDALLQRGSPATVPPGPGGPGWEGTPTARNQARARIERKRKLRADLVAYLVINVLLVGVWAATGSGYFWPGWVLAGWGAVLLLDAWDVYYRRPITEEEIDKELRLGR